jgi:aspartyl-tRNA(Asn)/glutamyl-tRNA(Gln) amidotransferase subunit A
MYAVHRHDLQTRIEGYNMITAGRLAMGAAIGAADYLDALRLRRSLTDALDAALDDVDCIATACALSVAPRYNPADRLRHWPLQLNMFNVTGHPALSVPTGLDPDGLPMSIQIVGRCFNEKTVLRVGQSIETVTRWREVARPSLRESETRKPPGHIK